MDKGYEKERFESLSIKSSVVKRFRKYSKSISKSNSMTLLSMMEFFDQNELSPEDDLKPGLMETENRIKKRINALVAIIKNIEKNQTKPTMAMLQSLFAATEPKKERRIMREKTPEEFKAQFEKNKTESQSKIDNKWNT
ncbi:BfmA/BtgA family mobilization protein [uncultured Algibacter sp.]|mgnify:FL=1|uniref:BfmA/BtgA family mobilization protein n=1 Tax=uncultured Algibacter sp. TaxID=298659 RepID=UPI0030EBCF11|tara:strand:- start:265 stop:681 length:417 start_codon:yes stop_codon:yes gene_type:complete